MLRKFSYFLNSTVLKTAVFVLSDNFELFNVNYEVINFNQTLIKH